MKERYASASGNLRTAWLETCPTPTDTDDKEAYKWAWDALEAESVGNLAQAEERWHRVQEKFLDESKLPFSLNDQTVLKARWGWLAEKRIADIEKARNALAAAKEKIKENRRHDLPFNPDPNTPEATGHPGVAS